MGSRLIVSSKEVVQARAKGKQVKNILVIFATFKYYNKVEFGGYITCV